MKPRKNVALVYWGNKAASKNKQEAQKRSKDEIALWGRHFNHFRRILMKKKKKKTTEKELFSLKRDILYLQYSQITSNPTGGRNIRGNVSYDKEPDSFSWVWICSSWKYILNMGVKIIVGAKPHVWKLLTSLCCHTPLMLTHPSATQDHVHHHCQVTLDPPSRSGVKRGGTSSCHLGWKVPLHHHMWPRLPRLCGSCSYRALRLHSKDLLDLSFTLWWWLKRKSTSQNTSVTW